MAVAGGALTAVIIFLTTDWLRATSLLVLKPVAGASRPFRHEALAATRIFVGVSLTLLIANLTHLTYPGWAAVGALAVMQGTHLHITASRAVQRTGGTVVGILVAFVILNELQSMVSLISIVGALLFATESVVAFNYAFGMATITPVALLMAYMAFPQPVNDMLAERLMETIIGAVVGALMAVIMSTLDDRAYLAKMRSE